MRKFTFLFSLLLIILIHFVAEWFFNQPQAVGADVPAGKLMSLSFAPFREGYSPLEEIFPLPEHVEEDVHLLADKTGSIRTYSSLGGMQPTPQFARKYGLKMIQGGWLSNVAKDNRKEVDALIKSANENPDVVDRVIIGNEVLLRGELDVNRLIAYIREVKQAVKQPVSYADVWSMYMKYPQLMHEVDFITIHILPYWEDEPISIDHATEHLEKIVKQIEDEARGIAPGKPILIGESGWPAAGRQRGMATPSIINEAKFIRGLIEVANHHGFDYNIVEAFNQPWKSNLEGVVGANWGLFSADRIPVFPLTGPVAENPRWQLHFGASSVLLLLFVGVFFKKLLPLSAFQSFVLLVLAQIFCMCLVAMADFLWYTSYSFWQRGYALIMIAANTVLGFCLLQRCHQLLEGGKAVAALAWRLRTLFWLFALLAIYKTFWLAVNGRYLSFPLEQFFIPVLGLIALLLLTTLVKRHLSWRLMALDQLIGWSFSGRKDKILGLSLLFAIFAMILGETRAFMLGADFILAHPGFIEGLPIALEYTLKNMQLLFWLFSLLVLSMPFLANSCINNKKSGD